MINLDAIIETVEGLLAQSSAQATTYAALECRLAIEKVCYERLKIAHDYIAHDDLRRWQPRDVVETLIAEVDGRIDSGFTLSISREPCAQGSSKPPADDDWVVVGTQAGLDPKKLGSLWHALSNLALHVRLPRTRDEEISAYGDEREVRAKVKETLAELKRLAEGSLISTGFSRAGEVSFMCECGQLNKKRIELLGNGQTVSCVRPDCVESYVATIEGDDIYFERRKLTFQCACGDTLAVQTRVVEKLRRDQQLSVQCECGGNVKVVWRLEKASFPKDYSA